MFRRFIPTLLKNLVMKTTEPAAKVPRKQEPRVKLLALPKCIMKNFIVFPKYTLMNCSLNQCNLSWFRKISSEERKEKFLNDPKVSFEFKTYWYKLSDGFTYMPTHEDVAHNLRLVCTPSNGTIEGPKYSIVSSNQVEMGPDNCPFEKRQKKYTSQPLEGPNQFRFVTYNILADMYADSDYSRDVLFAHCPAHALDIEYRRQLFIKEMLGYNSDVFCLQEVDKKEFLRNYEPIFKLHGGYSGLFDRKGGSVSEGLAIFFRDEKFELVDSHSTILRELVEAQPKVVSKKAGDCEDSASGKQVKTHPILDTPDAENCRSQFDDHLEAINRNPELKKRFVDRHTSMQTSLLRFKDYPNDFLLVGNTHLYFAPDADHIRLLQGSICLKYMEYVKEFHKRNLETNLGLFKPQINILFCGDMNSTPNCGLYKLATSGEVGSDFPDWSSNENEAVVGLSLKTGLNLKSAYNNIPYTNYTPLFNGCLDYIYYAHDGLICDGTVPFPDHEDVIATGGIPSEVFPSDHLALVANFRLADT